MEYKKSQSILFIVIILAMGLAIGWAGSQGSSEAFGVSLFMLCGIISFLVNWLIFIPSYFAQTEHYFDLTGSLTYLSLMWFSFILSGSGELRTFLVVMMVSFWAVRLGSFLFRRVKISGSDGRFDRLKTDFLRFLMVWTLQGLWVLLTAASALAAITSSTQPPLGVWAFVGLVFFLSGLTIEIVADQQKSRFRANPENKDRFIQTGLWAWSRHPNYFGEITLWCGVALVALPTLSGWQYATLVSPLFVFVLLTRISGVPLVEARGKKKWGDDPEYRAYLDRTPTLFLRVPRSKASE